MVTRLHDVEGEVGNVEALGVQDGDAAAAEGIAPAGKLVQGLEMEFKKSSTLFICLATGWGLAVQGLKRSFSAYVQGYKL